MKARLTPVCDPMPRVRGANGVVGGVVHPSPSRNVTVTKTMTKAAGRHAHGIAEMKRTPLALISLLVAAACLSPEPKGIAPATPAQTTVKMDFRHRPLPEIPLPNDIATRLDPASATGRRVNASMIAPTQFESRVRALIDELDGWGVLQPITIPFTGPLDVQSILDAHRDADYALADDVVYLINIDRDSDELGRLHHLDVGNGNYPVVLEKINNYWKNDPRGWLLSILYEEADEDVNSNGVLDPGEDTDADGVLDLPNYLPEYFDDDNRPARDDLAGRADALMTFYERETHTLILKPLVPLRERTTYAVVVTRRLKDAQGDPVGSPFPYINHAQQTQALTVLPQVLPEGLALSDVAFAFSFTTQTIESNWIAVRDGLYEHGVQKHIGETFPPDVAGLMPLREGERFEKMTNPYVLYTEHWLPTFRVVAEEFLGGEPGTVAYQQQMDGTQYIDYQIIGYYDSPQLFQREGADGEWIPFNDQSWPQDLDRVPAPTRSERVYFYLSVPRKEISARGEGKPAPVVIFGHGYTSNRYEVASFGSYFAKYGLATLAIDNVSHGLSVNPEDRADATELMTDYGLGPYVEAVFTDRAYDQNNDGVKDSGADFWTAYLFHTRDVVRQTAMDYMQLIRILRAFDGERQWGFDADGDGQNGLAGDFDGDGVIDIGGDAMITMTGGSLGGMMTTLMGSVEPELTAIAPIVPGGGLGDGGIRSQQSGVPEAFILRPMAPLYVGTLGRADDTVEAGWVADPEGESLYLETIVPDLNDAATLWLATVPGIHAGDTMVVFNEANGEQGCGYVSPEGTVRASAASDQGDATRVAFYAGDALVLGGDCEVQAGKAPTVQVSTFEREVIFQTTQIFAAGSPLVALQEGLGLRRGNPELRRFAALGQMVIDPADMSVMAPHLLKEPLTYPGTGQTTGAHIFLLPAVGDMSVPVSMGMSIGRAAGLIEYLEPHPDWGKPANQVLLDTYTAEAVNTLKRYTDPDGNGVHIDLDNFSGGQDIWGDRVPRLDPPLRLGFYEEDPLGGRSAAIFAYGDPGGRHGFPSPGEGYDAARAQCQADCTDASCDCRGAQVFDIGNFFFNLIGRYLSSGGRVLSDDLCLARDDCDDKPPLPELRYNPDDPDGQRPAPVGNCGFPAPQVAGTPELDAVANAPARCGMAAYTWQRDATLGEVTGLGTDNLFPAALLRTLAAERGIPIPREILYDATVQPYAYVTQERGQLVEATALVAWPSTYDGEAPLSVLLFLGEPDGLHSECAPSRELGRKGLVGLLATFGHIVVAPDPLRMMGFGDDARGLNPYLIGEAAAFPALDAVRALGKLPDELRATCAAPEIFVLGDSQGGHAALFVERLAPYYAPEIRVLGGAVTVPLGNLMGHLQRGAQEFDRISHRMAAFLASASDWYGLETDPLFQAGVADTIMTTLASDCELDVLSSWPDLLSVFTTDLIAAAHLGADLSALSPWDCVLAENNPATTSIDRIATEPSGFLMVLGTDDKLVASDVERAGFQALCDSGAQIQFLECADADHGKVIMWALPEILDFMDARLAGTPLDDAKICSLAAPQTCSGQP